MSPAEEGKLLTGEDHHPSLGRPSRIHRVTWADLATLVIVMISMTVAAIAVFNRSSAMYLGQKYQLVVLGFALSIMASCSSRQILKFSLVYEAGAGRSTLQNFDALLRFDSLSGAVSLGPRLILPFLYCLPLGLSVGYKEFIGGSTTVETSCTGGWFGFTAAPGYQLIGNGLSLLPNVYLPFWSQQMINRTYGFNLYVADNQTAAVLDAPLPAYLTALQETLSSSESISLTAKVNATVTQMISPSNSERNDRRYWDAKRRLFQAEDARVSRTFVNATEEMWAGSGPDRTNFTETFLSIANMTKGQTVESQAERFISIRRTCWGTWNVTNANITLVEVHGLQSINELRNSEQSVIQKATLSIARFFFNFIDEYNWETRQNWNQPFAVAGNMNSSDRFRPAVNTRPALVASMLWARITSLNGPERPDPGIATTSYWTDSDSITATKTTRTLQRNPWLIFIIVIHPVLTILAAVGKALLHTTPMSDNFGVISLLAGFKGGDPRALQGAALSGKLTSDVKVTFNARDCGLRYERIEIELGSNGKSTKLRPDKLYG